MLNTHKTLGCVSGQDYNISMLILYSCVGINSQEEIFFLTFEGNCK